MVTRDFLNDVNSAYRQLEMRQAQIVSILFHRMFEIDSGWYSGHYHRNDAGDWCMDSYPIPVISISGICDIEIDFHRISVSTKLPRAKALNYSYDKVVHYDFEVFGVADYLCDFYRSGMSVEKMKSNISNSDEQEIGFSFAFPFDVEGQTLFEFVKLLRREGFYY